MAAWHLSAMSLAMTVDWRGLASAVYDLLVLAVGIALTAVIPRAAWEGWPETFDRWMWWTVYMLAGIPGGILLAIAQGMETATDWQRFIQRVLGSFGVLLFFVAFGCGIAILTYRRRTPPPSE